MKKLITLILSLSMLSVVSVPGLNTMASKSLNKSSINHFDDKTINWKESKSVYVNINSDLKYEGTLNISDEYEVNNSSSQKEFYKKAKLSGLFFNSYNNESISTNGLDITFKYDKNKAYIANPEEDIQKKVISSNESSWKVSNKEEIFYTASQCIVSQQSNIYQKESWYNLRKTWDYYDNFHIDILCTPNGDIDLNVKSSPYLANEAFNEKIASMNYKTLENGIIRMETIKDYHYKKNEDKDKYNYVTRKIELVYKNSAGKNIAIVNLESNFRYNKVTKEAECLSTNHHEAVLNYDDSIEVFSRTGNETRSIGGSYSNINFDYVFNDDTSHSEAIIKTNCDFNGNISTDIS